MIHSKPRRGCRIQDPGIPGYRWWKTADFSHSAGTAHGAPPKMQCKPLPQIRTATANEPRQSPIQSWKDTVSTILRSGAIEESKANRQGVP